MKGIYLTIIKMAVNTLKAILIGLMIFYGAFTSLGLPIFMMTDPTTYDFMMVFILYLPWFVFFGNIKSFLNKIDKIKY